MLYTELKIGEEIFKLRLNTKNSIMLEKSLGYNPIGLLMDIERGKMPRLEDILKVLHACLQTYHHGYNMDKVWNLYDDYVSDGKTMFDLIPVFVEVFQQCGFLNKIEEATEEEVEEAKN